MNKKVEQLRLHIKENEIDLFFDLIDSMLSDNSDLTKYVTVLHSKYTQYKTDVLKGFLSFEERQLLRNQIISGLLNLLDLADDDDFITEEVKKSITYFHNSISQKQLELKEVTNKKADGIEKAGYSLLKLGQIMSGKKDELNQSVSFDQTLKAASRKVLRRMTIGCTELKELRVFQNKLFIEIIQLYRELVLYLDFPEEKIDAKKIELLQQNFADIKTHANKLEASLGKQVKTFNEMLPGIQKFIATKELISNALISQNVENDSVKQNIDSTYNNFDAVEQILHQTISVLNEVELSDIELIKQIKGLISELQLNLEEL